MNSISRNKALKQLCRKDYFLNTKALLNKRWKSDDQEEIKVKVSPTTAMAMSTPLISSFSDGFALCTRIKQFTIRTVEIPFYFQISFRALLGLIYKLNL